MNCVRRKCYTYFDIRTIHTLNLIGIAIENRLLKKEVFMKYSIGEFAKNLGVTPDTLRLYEKMGIMKPMKDDHTRCRYYDDLDARNLLMSRWYQSMNISLKEAAVLATHASGEEVAAKIGECRKNLEEELRLNTLLLNKILEIEEEINGIKNRVNQCRKRDISGLYRIRQTAGDTLLMENCSKSIIEVWMEKLPFTFYSYKIKSENILSEEYRPEYNWGLAITEQDLLSINLKVNRHMEFIPPKTCISSVIIVRHREEFIIRDSLRHMFEYMKENRYTVAGDILGKIILIDKDREYTYLEVNIPCS